MATQRKSARRSRTARPVKKAGAASRPRAKAAPAARAKRPAAPKAQAKAAPPKPAVKARPPVKAALKAAASATATRPPAKRGKRPAVKRPFVTEVRPLGVLPPGSRARSIDRPPLPVAKRVHAVPPKPKPSIESNRHQGAQRVTEKDMKEFEERLLLERGRILKEMGHLENTVLKINPRDSAGDLSGYSFHMADAGTDAMEREKAFLFASSEGRALIEINAALRRLYNGEYGVCESCGQPIARARLEAMPHARLCVSCKEKEERASRNAQ